MSDRINEFIDDADRMVNHLGTAATRLENAIEDVRTAKQRSKEACEALQAAEAEVASELAVMALSKEGPLAGLATSSKAYQYALDNELAIARSGSLRDLAWSASKAQAEAERASIEFEQATARFSAARHAADLLASMLHATRI